MNRELIKATYKSNLLIAREEDPERAHSLAAEWTVEDISIRIRQFLDQEYSKNKEHFE